MIKYKLICKNCDFKFDSWFASSAEYEKLKIKKFLSCHNCNSKKVEKTLMAPKLINSSYLRNFEVKDVKFKEVRKKIKKYQKFIKDNFDYVGDNFSYEARSIHYSDKKKDKGIYGNATTKEVKELEEEGIDTEIIPWVNENEN